MENILVAFPNPTMVYVYANTSIAIIGGVLVANNSVSVIIIVHVEVSLT